MQGLAIIVGVGVFVLFMSFVGNPHFVETIIGVILAFASGFYAFHKTKQATKSNESIKAFILKLVK